MTAKKAKKPELAEPPPKMSKRRPANDVLASPESIEITKKDAALVLGEGKMPSSTLLNLLKLPAKIFEIGPDDSNYISFTADKRTEAEQLAEHLLFHDPFPANLPDYGLFIARMSSTVYATFIDKKRKIIVCESIGSRRDDSRSWDRFEAALAGALQLAEELKGEKFSFVVRGEVNKII